jgi:hypothetical protein
LSLIVDAAVQAQEAYETAQNILYEREEQETANTRAQQLRLGPFAMSGVVEAAHDELVQAGVGHDMPAKFFMPPHKGWKTPHRQLINALWLLPWLEA